MHLHGVKEFITGWIDGAQTKGNARQISEHSRHGYLQIPNQDKRFHRLTISTKKRYYNRPFAIITAE